MESNACDGGNTSGRDGRIHMITIQDLRVCFNDRPVLDGVNLEVPSGELLVLMGKNGAGKSVLLKAIAGLIGGYEGSIRIDGSDIRSLRAAGPLTLAYVFQRGGLFDSMNVFDNVAFGLRRRKIDEVSVEKKVVEALNRVGLAGSEVKLPSELSGGMQKRVGLARAICLNPGVILYDDPTAGLDPILSDSIANLILEITGTYATTSIMASHDLKVARKIAGRVALLYGGTLVFAGPVDEFFSGTNSYVRQFIDGDIEGPIDIF
jgi:phospholipid/cholesterol/gamma-HCH transport system ATP-binding protein